MNSPTPDQLHELVATHSIRQALVRYCRGVDLCDLDLAKSAYHSDAHERHGPFDGKAHDFLEFVIPQMMGYEVLSHQLTTHYVEVHDTSAFSEAAFIAIQRAAGSNIDERLAGRYIDRFEYRDNEWKVASRLVVMDWWRRDERGPLTFEFEASLEWGKRGRDDAFYRRGEVLNPGVVPTAR